MARVRGSFKVTDVPDPCSLSTSDGTPQGVDGLSYHIHAHAPARYVCRLSLR